VKRRLDAGAATVPERLVMFRFADWADDAGADVDVAIRAFYEAQRAWGDEHGWPTGPVQHMRDNLEQRRALKAVTSEVLTGSPAKHNPHVRVDAGPALGASTVGGLSVGPGRYLAAALGLAR
jgi:hypothetical protein